MPETILLIDYENVKDTGLKDLPPHHRVQLFIGKEQKPKLTFIQEQLGQEARLDLIQVAEQGRNNLDFYIAFYLGKIIAEESNAHYIVYSNDQDLDPLLAHLNKRGISCSRIGPPRGGRVQTRAVAAPKAESPRSVERRAQPRTTAPVRAPVVTKPAQPAATKPAPAANNTDQLSEALAFLKRSGKRRPTTLKKLINSLESHLQIKPLEAGKLIRLLDQSGVLSLTPAGAVSYKI